MSTWLDYYICGAAQTVSSALGALRLPDAGPQSDLEAMRVFALAELGQAAQGAFGESGSDLSRLTLLTCLMPWLCQGDIEAALAGAPGEISPALSCPPVAYQLKPELVAALVQGEPPKSDAVANFLESHNLYLDLPGRGLPVTDQQHIRALFVQPTSAPGIFCFLAVLGSGASNAMSGRWAWTASTEGEVFDRWGSDVEDLPADTVIAVCWRIIRLAVLYAESLANAGEAPPLLAHTTEAELAKLKPKKRAAKRKRFSLFQVRVLDRRASHSLSDAVPLKGRA